MKIFLLMALNFLLLMNAFSLDPDSIFHKANAKYAEGSYEQAIDLYLRIDSMCYSSANLYFNTGNAYFRSNKSGPARLFYERALELDPSDQDIHHNLSYVKSLLTDRFEEVPILFFIRWYRDITQRFSSNGWAMISIILFLAALAGFFVYVFFRQRGYRRIGFYSGLVFFFLSMLTLIFSVRQNQEDGAAIVMAPAVTVKSAPRDSGKDLFILHEGAKIWVQDELESWIEIRISDGREGWIPGDEVEMI